MVNLPAIVGQAHAVPPPLPQDRLWEEFFSRHYDGDPVAGRIFSRSGVQTRHGVADPRREDVSAWSTARRMERFVDDALPLARDAVAGALDDAGVAPQEVGQLTVVSCTGYATPGLDILLARELGMSDDLQRLHVGHMGCYAALPALASAADAAAARGKIAVLACVELTSLHLQPPEPDGEIDLEQAVAHALFSDAAAALAVAPDGDGPRVADLLARTEVDHADAMTWEITDLGFRMGLSPRIPDLLGTAVAGAVEELLGRNGFTISDVAGWAIHPGGPRIVEVVAERLGLDDEDVAASRAVLREYGNCSSATVLLILERLLDARGTADGPIVALAFGPGLTLYAALLLPTPNARPNRARSADG